MKFFDDMKLRYYLSMSLIYRHAFALYSGVSFDELDGEFEGIAQQVIAEKMGLTEVEDGD